MLLMFLTVSLPYSISTYAVSSSCHQEDKPPAQCPEKCGDQKPWNDMTEEKAAETNNTLSEEYLHEHHSGPEAGFLGRNTYLSDRGDSPRIPYHGELLVPPPNTL